MKKYDVIFCSCGRVHFIDYNKLIDVCDKKGKELLHICNNCGATIRRGLDEYMDGKSWYSVDARNKEFEDTSKIGYIISSPGTPIPMKTGFDANCFLNGVFCDDGDYEFKYRNNFDLKEKYLNDSKIVDTQKLINNINDNDKLKNLSGYAVNIDWTSTEFETDYNN